MIDLLNDADLSKPVAMTKSFFANYLSSEKMKFSEMRIGALQSEQIDNIVLMVGRGLNKLQRALLIVPPD